MPIYTYRCENCGVQFERQQSFNDETLKRCPECNKNKLRRVITPAGIVFKGSGWYVTDSKSSRSSTVSTPSAAKGEAKTDTKSDGKDAPAAATPAASVSSDTGSSKKADSGSSKGSSNE